MWVSERLRHITHNSVHTLYAPLVTQHVNIVCIGVFYGLFSSIIVVITCRLSLEPAHICDILKGK